MKRETSIVIMQKEHIDRVVTLASIGTQLEEPTSYSGSRVQPYKDISSTRAQAPEDFFFTSTDVLQYENTKQGILAAPSNF